MLHKKAEFYDYLKTFKELPEVVCIQETWDKKSYQPIRLMGYKEPVSYWRNDDTKGGWVATFIRIGLDSEEIKNRQNNPNLEVSVFRIFGESKNIDIVNSYTNLYTMKHIVSRMSSYFPNRWPPHPQLLQWFITFS